MKDRHKINDEATGSWIFMIHGYFVKVAKQKQIEYDHDDHQLHFFKFFNEQKGFLMSPRIIVHCVSWTLFDEMV